MDAGRRLDLPIGGPVLRDHGAVRDLAASLAEGLRAHVADVGRAAARAPTVLLQLDEPSLPAVLAGRVPHRERPVHATGRSRPTGRATTLRP